MRIAIIEDDKSHAELMERSIGRELPEAQLDFFEDIGHCLSFLDDENPDIIISDYLLPDMDGLVLLEELAKRKKEIPVVVITGQGSESIAVKAIKLGAYDYIVKSGDFFSLIPSIIRRVIQKKELKRALEESRSLYEHEKNKLNFILASMVTCLAAIRPDMTLSFANPEFERAFGKQYAGKTCQDVFGERSGLGELCLKVTGDRQTQSAEFEDARGRYWQVIISPGIENAGEMLAAVLVFQDITERKSYEKRLRKLSKRMISVQEEERARIARELHDELGQTLTALKFCASWLKDNVSLTSESLGRFQEMCDLIDGSFSTVRRISSDLRPGILDHIGLGPAVEWYVSEFERRWGMECLALIDLPEKRLSSNIETGCYRIVQEALTNVVRHAKASRVTVSIKEKDGTVFLQVADNGIGIDSSKIRSPFSTGISGMGERTEGLSGKIEVIGCPGSGTQVNVQVPMVHR